MTPPDTLPEDASHDHFHSLLIQVRILESFFEQGYHAEVPFPVSTQRELNLVLLGILEGIERVEEVVETATATDTLAIDLNRNLDLTAWDDLHEKLTDVIKSQ